MLIVAMLIAMGPYVRIDGQVLLLGEMPIHLPAQTIDFIFSALLNHSLSMPIDTVL